MDIEQASILENKLTKGVNLFTGAGFSVLAEDESGRSLPLGGELKSELVEEFGREDIKDLSLDKISSILKNSDEKAFNEYITDRFRVGDYDSRYEILGGKSINIKRIFTTNLDDLIYNIYEKSEDKYVRDVDIKGPSRSDREAVDVYTLHGCVVKPDRPYYFSTTELSSSFNADPDRWWTLVDQMEKHPTLFWGHSLDSPGVLETLSPRNNSAHDFEDMWITVHPDVEDQDIIYYESLGFKIIVSTTNELLDFFREIDEENQSESAAPRTEEKYRDDLIPDPNDVVARSIKEFYLGSAPRWIDIFRGDIPKSHYFDVVRDKVLGGSNTIITGLTACGKSTLMMQIANDIDYEGYKLMLDAPTKEKAKLIVRKLGRERVLVFIDDVADSIDAFTELMKYRKIQCVGCDRTQNIDRVRHKLSNFDLGNIVVDVTDLTDGDIQNVISSIPVELRVDSPTRPETEAGEDLSIYEVVEENINPLSLDERFRDSMSQLGENDPLLLDFLLVTCYVHKCRTPISTSMLIAFFRNDDVSYDEIDSLSRSVGREISYYTGDLVDEQQDFYAPRSNIIADAVIKQAPSRALRRMVHKFHNEITPRRIHNFDTFARHGYSHEIMKRVFTDWENGKEFYRFIHENRHNSPYVLQQGALYLRDHFRYNEAFAMIDEAVVSSEYENTTLLNSYARILFDANVRRDSSENEVRSSLRESMDILEKCYYKDDSKVHHVTSYAHQSLRYLDKYGPEDSREFIVNAYQWLKSERSRSPWNRSVESLHKRVKRHVDEHFPSVD